VKNIIVIIVMVVLFGCSGPQKKIVETKSGNPEIIINTRNIDVVKSLLILNMGKEEWGYLLLDDSKDSLTFIRQVRAGEEADKAQLMVGTRSGTIPERIVVFQIVRIKGAIQTIAYPSLSSQNEFGQTNQVRLENNIPIFNALQELLISIKTKVESDLMLNLKPQ
jgi:hypothetical protein